MLRDTFDLDVLVSAAAENLRRASLAMTELGMSPYVPVKLEELADPEVRRRLREERNLIALGYIDPASPLRRVDVLLDGPFDVEQVIARAVVRGGARVIGLADLITMKRAAGRPRDLEDAEWLARLGREG
ncbi:MAG: hypothetical protein KF729_27035 [Sandaracinaceae bacterium]|nr:hypothetical protein [Sandaracinaceae bacterium]